MSRTVEAIRAVADLFNHAGSFLLLAHENPDGDAVGSLLGLAHLLRDCGKFVTVGLDENLPEHLSWLPGATEVVPARTNTGSYDVAVILDCDGFARVGIKGYIPFSYGKIVNIDHHPGHGGCGDLNLVDQTSAATGELVLEVAQAMGATLSPEGSTCLYAALSMDTGNFRFSNTTSRAFRSAAALVELGADPNAIYMRCFGEQPAGRVALLGKALSTLALSPSGKTSSLYVTERMLTETGTDFKDMEGFADHARNVRGVEVGVLVKERDSGEWRVSLRSRGRVDVSAIARANEGGGHKNAAGATFHGTLDEVILRIYALIDQSLYAGEDG